MPMCRNITTLRGLEPSATPEEIEAAARQYVRKVSGVQKTSEATETAVDEIAYEAVGEVVDTGGVSSVCIEADLACFGEGVFF